MGGGVPWFGRWVAAPTWLGPTARECRERAYHFLLIESSGRKWWVRNPAGGRMTVHEPADIAVALQFRDEGGRVQVRFRRAEGGWAWIFLVLGFFFLGFVGLFWDESRREHLKARLWGILQLSPPGAAHARAQRVSLPV